MQFGQTFATLMQPLEDTMFVDIMISFLTFFITTWLITYLLILFVRIDWRIQRPLRLSVVLALFVSFIGLNINLTPMIARWISSKMPAPKAAALTPEEALKLKNEFLSSLEKFVAQPNQITPQNRNELFNRYAVLFPNPQNDLNIYFSNIAKFYDCQQFFYEDALQAMKTKKIAKSEKRKECHSADGSFFNRKNLIPEVQAKADDEAIESLAKGKKIVRDGKEVTVTEGLLQQQIAAQQKNKEVLRALFSGGQ